MEKRIFENVMNFLQSYGEKEIRFEWTSYEGGIDYVEWEYGWNNLGRKTIPTSIMNLIVTIVEETGEDMFDDVFSETDGYRLVARFFPKEKTIQLRMQVEEYTNQEEYTDGIFLSETSEVLKYMKDNKIKNMEFQYDGGGDSGEISQIFVNGKDKSVDQFYRDKDTSEILGMVYDFLSSRYGGWEIDDGSQGTIELKDNGYMSISHNWNGREWYDTGKEKLITTDNFN